MTDGRTSTTQPSSLLDHALTKRQERAMLAFLYRHNAQGFDLIASDGDVWDWGVRPWPTMRNLESKGLIAEESWDEERGYLWGLTDSGCEYMRFVVAQRAVSA